jgi:glycosyltransferase involved in cell wall biosynthesis
MKIAIVHNYYGKLSGEETVIENLAALLAGRGVSVCRFSRSSADIEDKLSGKMAAFFSGIHNPFAAKAFGEFLKNNRPAVVHIHNLYPLISPSILAVCKVFSVPVVMTVHNFRLVCPNGLLLSHNEICHRCLGGREYWCVLRNCENSVFKSTGYALRTAAARMLRRYFDNVDHFICLSEFQKNILVGEGLPVDRVSVLANPVSLSGTLEDEKRMAPPAFAGLRRQVNSGMTDEWIPASAGMTKAGVEQSDGALGDDIVTGMGVHPPSIPPVKGGKNADEKGRGGYVAYVGRISPEKDIFTLLEAARRLGDVPFKFAGDYHRMPEVLKNKPLNVEFLGQLGAKEIVEFYRNTRMVVFATRCYEGFPTVLLEAMSHGLPIVCSRIGGLPEIVEEDVNGLLYEPGNVAELTARIQALWKDAVLSEELGYAGRQKLREKYDAEKLVDRIIRIYEKAIGVSKGRKK